MQDFHFPIWTNQLVITRTIRTPIQTQTAIKPIYSYGNGWKTYTYISSVVSVLISLISDTWTNGSHDIKLISLGREFTTIACYWGSQALPKRCTTAWAWRISPNLVRIFVLTLFNYNGCG
ncbi:hypothetical protein D8674_019791 [Pyrus ussuriensis x Pyrus communis]|uniref:Uncharacterized protein n=1 Tax=Pyrus ussuriensis x Pyrus communis TaxID=2448454 RepID=A0A5N5G8J7_9ROSA|nr:hypothetical protein D8674_019791 [Pyrus ussuriensis x Pyrus communis]